jgi:hypothetical protein
MAARAPSSLIPPLSPAGFQKADDRGKEHGAREPQTNARANRIARRHGVCFSPASS